MNRKLILLFIVINLNVVGAACRLESHPLLGFLGVLCLVASGWCFGFGLHDEKFRAKRQCVFDAIQVDLHVICMTFYEKILEKHQLTQFLTDDAPPIKGKILTIGPKKKFDQWSRQYEVRDFKPETDIARWSLKIIVLIVLIIMICSSFTAFMMRPLVNGMLACLGFSFYIYLTENQQYRIIKNVSSDAINAQLGIFKDFIAQLATLTPLDEEAEFEAIPIRFLEELERVSAARRDATKHEEESDYN